MPEQDAPPPSPPAATFAELMKSGEALRGGSRFCGGKHGDGAGGGENSGGAAAGCLPSLCEINVSDYAEKNSYRKNGVSQKVLDRLRRERHDSKIDLHGSRVHDAHAILEQFLSEAHARGARVLEVVHGRGLHSSSREGGALRGYVRYWLQHCRFVLGYCEPGSGGGGVNRGALLVLLKEGPGGR